MATILIVDDNEMNQDILSRRLIRKGYTILTADNGPDAILAAQRQQPDIILMDVGLPGMTGYEAAQALKADTSTVHIPIVALTAHATGAARAEALAAGCEAFATKPIEFLELMVTIEELLHHAGRSPETKGCAS
jgi:two-component system, cell cycle response regulator DivK